MCSMASTGSSMPTMRPTSRAHRPPQLTTCSAWIVPCSVTTSQVPSGRGFSSVTRVFGVDLGAVDARRLGIGVGRAGRIEVAVGGVEHGADEVLLLDQRQQLLGLASM